MNFIRS